jgi:hypothetical protein
MNTVTSQSNVCSECDGEGVIHAQQNGDDVEFPCKACGTESPVRSVEEMASRPASTLTLREHIAIQVLQGLWIKEGDKGYSYEGAAVTALEQANAMLKALAGQPVELV